MKVVTIVGARPQFIKAAPLSRELRREHQEVLVHTGQHYDDCMSGVFFRELNLPQPDYNLGVGSGPHGRQTADMLAGIEEVLEREQPDWVLVYGDTNSTLAGALAAAKMHIPIAHVEAGVRSYDRQMPEEVNRVLTDHLSALLLCPTPRSVNNLAREGITHGACHVGDIMYDALLMFLPLARTHSSILEEMSLEPQQYGILTLHRAENVDSDERLSSLVNALWHLDLPLLFPAHPRTKKRLHHLGLLDNMPPQVNLLPPLGYLDMLLLVSQSFLVLTDSGGLQREAHFLSVPSIVLRSKTEWPELVEMGSSWLVDQPFDDLATKQRHLISKPPVGTLFGSGNSSREIVYRLRHPTASDENASTAAAPAFAITNHRYS